MRQPGSALHQVDWSDQVRRLAGWLNPVVASPAAPLETFAEQTLRSLELERAQRIKAPHPQAAPSPPAHRTGDGASAAGVPLRTQRTRGARWALRRPA